MVRAWHGHGMASVNQTRPHCVNQMEKTHSKPLAARHGNGTTWARHGHGMLCVNRPLRVYKFGAFLPEDGRKNRIPKYRLFLKKIYKMDEVQKRRPFRRFILLLSSL